MLPKNACRRCRNVVRANGNGHRFNDIRHGLDCVGHRKNDARDRLNSVKFRLKCKFPLFLGIVFRVSGGPKERAVMAYTVQQNDYLCTQKNDRRTMSSLKEPECGLIGLARHDDLRGSLCVAEAMREVPFAVDRVFWITDVPAGGERGGHAHRTCHEAVFAVCGGFKIDVDAGNGRTTYRLERPEEGIVIPAGVWCRLYDFQPATVCVVLASGAYDAAGYVNDYETFKSGKGWK